MNFKYISTILCLFFVWILASCSKLDTTNLGDDLIPEVDNVNTFADTLEIVTTSNYLPDSLTRILPMDRLAIGAINNDPLFGKTTADAYFQVKPLSFPYYYGFSKDTILAIDSIVLSLAYAGSWGDTTLPQQFEVSEINDPTFALSEYKRYAVDFKPNVGNLIGSYRVGIPSPTKYVKFNRGKDSSVSQIRLKLADAGFNSTLINRFKGFDSTANGAFRKDSLFRLAFNGLAIKAVGSGSNSLMYFDPSDPKTRLEIYYQKTSQGRKDTTFSTWGVNTIMGSVIPPSAVANNIVRNTAGSEAGNPLAYRHYIQTVPGNYVNMQIPGLANYSNRIVHNARIEVVQVPQSPLTDSMFSVPFRMYLDLKDSTTSAKWKPIYFDLNPGYNYNPDDSIRYFPVSQITSAPVSSIAESYFGGVPRTKPLATGQAAKYYYFNITRYIQNIATRQAHSYGMRLFAPSRIYYPGRKMTDIEYPNPIAFGRVRIGSGNDPNPATRLKLIVIYSRLK